MRRCAADWRGWGWALGAAALAGPVLAQTAPASAAASAPAQAQPVPPAAVQTRALDAPMTVEGAPQPPRTPRLAGAWRLEIDAPNPLDDLLRDYLDLARFQREYGAGQGGTQAGAVAAAPRLSGLRDAATGAAVGVARGVGRVTDGVASGINRVVPSGDEAAAGAAGSAQPADAAASHPTHQGLEADGTPAAEELPAVTLGELRRLVAAAPAQARELLETEGYFSADVSASLDAAASPRVARIRVEPGPRTRVGNVVLRFEGALDDSAQAGDATAQALQKRLRADWGLPAGRPFRQADWTGAKGDSLTLLRAQGYSAAGWSATSAMIDAQTQDARLFLIADSGPLFHFGTVTIEGLGYQRAQPLLNALPFEAGTPYSDKLLYDYQERLQKLNLFESVSVMLDPDPAKADAAPVTVRVKELPRQQAVFGVGVSANTGPRVTLEHTNRLLMGWDWQSRTRMELGRDLNQLNADLISHPRADGYRHLLSATVNRQDVEDTTTTSESLRIGRTRDAERIERTMYVEWQRARSRTDTAETAASALTANIRYVWRDVDSVLLPTRGLVASGELGAGRSFAADESEGFFGRALARLTGYWPLPARFFGQARIEAGRVQAKPGVGVPDTLLFRAGGDDSVRGYGWRTIGPEQDGLEIGARSLLTSSVEVQRPISPRRPALLWSAFVDAGDAADSFQDMRLKIGYGVGLRWRSPVGPLRLDLAYGEAERRLRLHFSVGIAL
ncbi:MAG: outer membrane protein assembly factor [Burkholderiales bacterium]|nr:outer membrane protein assembly factor [Burkholderiales bacterium]